MTHTAPGSSRRRWLRAVGSVSLLAATGCLDFATEGGAGEDDTVPDNIGAADAGEKSASEEDADADAIHPGYDTREVRIETPSGDSRGSVTAAIADTRELQYTGLSDTDLLPDDGGMLFVYESVAERVFVMREMGFGIDIVYADADGVITGIHHAPAPEPNEDGETQRYPGRGQYVLEVGYRWTSDRGVAVGDILRFDPDGPADTERNE